jgi:hypothetical protein
MGDVCEIRVVFCVSAEYLQPEFEMVTLAYAFSSPRFIIFDPILLLLLLPSYVSFS